MGKIVALVGMCGSGKSVVSEMFEAKGWKKKYCENNNHEKVIFL